MKKVKRVLSVIMVLTLLLAIAIPERANAAQLKLNTKKLTMFEGATYTLKVTGTSKKATWSSSKKTIATVTSNGKVKAVNQGDAIITANIDSKKLTCKLTVKASDDTYTLNDDWKVSGKWKFKFTSVEQTEDRNQFADSDPEQVIILNYDYENLGYEGKYMGLYFSSTNFKVIDEKGVVAQLYPANLTSHPQELPVDTKCEDAQQAYGLKNKSSKITVIVESYDEDYKKYTAKFELDIE